jgi:hypothetical protein
MFGSWHDFCDREPMGKFYNFAKISIKYPTYSANQTNCQKLKDAIASIKTELSNMKFVTTVKNSPLNDTQNSIEAAYNDKLTEYTTLYTTLTCDNYLANQAKAAQVSQSVNNGLNVVSGGNTYVKYGIGAAALIVGYMIIKRVINGKSK